MSEKLRIMTKAQIRKRMIESPDVMADSYFLYQKLVRAYQSKVSFYEKLLDRSSKMLKGFIK